MDKKIKCLKCCECCLIYNCKKRKIKDKINKGDIFEI